MNYLIAFYQCIVELWCRAKNFPNDPRSWKTSLVRMNTWCVLSSFVWIQQRQNGLKLCAKQHETGPDVIKLLSCSTQLSTKFILLINVKMPTIVGIFTFISMINTTSERLKARNVFIYRYFSFYEQLKFRAQLSWAWKKFYNLGSGLFKVCPLTWQTEPSSICIAIRLCTVLAKYITLGTIVILNTRNSDIHCQSIGIKIK